MQLPIYNIRMLELITILKELGEIRYKKEFLDAIGIERQSIRQIQLGIASFTSSQILTACEVYGVNVNWIYGFERKIFRGKK